MMGVGSLRSVYLYVYLCERERDTQEPESLKVGQARTRLNSRQPWVSLCWYKSSICLTQVPEGTIARPGSGNCDPNCICSLTTSTWWKGSPGGGSVVKNPPANAGASGDVGLIPESERSLGGENGNPLQDSCWDNPMDGGAWWSTVHGVPKSQTRLSMHAHTWWKV